MPTLKLPRDILAKFLPDHRSIVAFEKMFVEIDSNQNTNIDLINAISLTAEKAGASADLALALIDHFQQIADRFATSPAPIEHEVIQNVEPRFEQSNTFDYIEFDRNNGNSLRVGRMFYNEVDDTLNITQKSGVTQQIGEEIFIQVTNSTGSTILNGSLVGLTGSGTTVSLYNANGSVPPMYVLGVATHDIPNGARGRLTQFGRVREINTSSFAVGDTLYANPSVLGGLTATKPTAPNLVIPVGVVVQSAVLGQIFVRPILEQQRYYGSFFKTIDTSPVAANTAYPITFDTTAISNGVVIDTIQSRIKVLNSGYYTFNVSFQLTATNSSIKNIKMWFRKNGVDVPNTTLIRSLDSGTAVAVQSRTFSSSFLANDYIELVWASDDTGVLLDARAADTVAPFAPAAPAVTLVVNQSQQ